MAAARPFLALCDEKSEPALVVKEFSCGLWADPENKEQIKNALGWALSHPQEIKQMGIFGRKIAEEIFNKEAAMKKWVEVLNKIITG